MITKRQFPVFDLNEVPLFRAALAFTIGILLGFKFGNFTIGIASIGFLAIVGFLLFNRMATTKVEFRIRAIWVFLIFAILGFTHISNKQKSQFFSYVNLPKSDTTWLVSFKDNPVKKTNDWQVTATINLIDKQGKLAGKPAKVLLHFENHKESNVPPAGSEIVAYAALAIPQEPAHERMFDYRDYLWKRGITFHLHLFESNYVLRGAPTKSFAIKLAVWQQNLRQRLATYLDTKQAALASALLIGYTNDLNPADKQAFSETGTIHLLAVSGMHVGLIFGIIIWLLKPLHRPKLKWLRFVLAMIWLWLYILITGAPSSAVRAATMFSFGFLTKTINKSSNIYNIICFTWIVMLVIDPFVLFQTGFQLSFAAVIGIVSWYEWVQNAWQPKYKIPKYLWQLGSLAVVAQLATLPLTLYYFNQFPVYFLPANLIMVAMVVVAVNGLLFFMAVAIIPYVGDFIGDIVNIWLGWILTINNQFAALPNALITGISLNWWMTIALLFSFYAMFYAIRFKQKLALAVACSSILVFFSGWFFERQKLLNRNELYTLETYGGRISILVAAKSAWVASDSALLARNAKTLNRFYELMAIKKEQVTHIKAPRYHEVSLKEDRKLILKEVPKFKFNGNQRFVTVSQ